MLASNPQETVYADGPLSADTPLRFGDPLPTEADVVVIGGGVIGIFTALNLARRKKRVVVCEKGRIAAEQSSRNWGWIRQQGRDEAELPIMMEAIRLWHEVSAELDGTIGFSRQGITYLASSDSELEGLSNWLEIAQRHDLDSRLLSRRQVDELIDRSGERDCHGWTGGITTGSDARAEPWLAVPAVARLAQRDGAAVRENCAVRALEISAGRVTGVVTEEGSIRTEQVVLAAGAWSSLFARNHGIAFPQLSVCSTVARTAQLPEFMQGNAADEEFAIRRRRDGGYTISLTDTNRFFIGPDAFRHAVKYLPALKTSPKDTRYRPWAPSGYPDSWTVSRKWAADEQSPFETMRVLDPAPDPAAVSLARQRFERRFPSIGQPKILDAWAGMIDAMPDVVPIVDRAPGMDGLIVATGMSGHGFGIGPAFGRILADMVAGDPAGHDMSRFRFSRFTDGSRLVVGPGL